MKSAVFAAHQNGLAGCQTPPKAPAPHPPADGPLQVLAPGASGVSLSAVLSRSLADGRMEVVATLSNTSPSPALLHVQCAFSDGRGEPAGETPWRPLTIAAGASETVRFDSAGPQARRYAVRIR